MRKLFEIKNLKCSYDKLKANPKIVLDIEHLVFPYGKKIFIVGESGIGKSTILETLGLMNNTLVTSSDTVFSFFNKEGHELNIVDLWKYGDDAISQFRLNHFNFIFQSTNLMNNFTAYENVSFTRMLQGYSKEDCFKKAREVMSDLGMSQINESREVHELSGGQRQRLAFARAILPDFTVLFGDEPTGNLDAENAVRVMQILSKKLDEHQNSSAIIVSHDMHLATSFADVIVKIRKTQVTDDSNVTDDNIKEKIYKGVIDDECIFIPTENRAVWTNGKKISLKTEEFEDFLRKKAEE